MKETINLAKSSWTLVPGLFPIYYNLWVPLEIPREFLLGPMEVICIAIIIVFYQQSANLKRRSWKFLKKRGIISVSLFFVSLALYITAFETQNIYVSKYDISILMPFWTKGDLSYMINKSGDAGNAILSYGPEQVRNAINSEKGYASLTKIIFIVNYVSIFAFLTLSFCFFTARKPKDGATRRSVPAASDSSPS